LMIDLSTTIDDQHKEGARSESADAEIV
jgi:hypothetical protein